MTFEEEFPSLNDLQRQKITVHDTINGFKYHTSQFLEEEIKLHCLDKQRVRDVIEKCTQKYSDTRNNRIYVDDLLKELGL